MLTEGPWICCSRHQ